MKTKSYNVYATPKHIRHTIENNCKAYLPFGAVSNDCSVYLKGHIKDDRIIFDAHPGTSFVTLTNGINMALQFGELYTPYKRTNGYKRAPHIQ